MRTYHKNLHPKTESNRIGTAQETEDLLLNRILSAVVVNGDDRSVGIYGVVYAVLNLLVTLYELGLEPCHRSKLSVQRRKQGNRSLGVSLGGTGYVVVAHPAGFVGFEFRIYVNRRTSATFDNLKLMTARLYRRVHRRSVRIRQNYSVIGYLPQRYAFAEQLRLVRRLGVVEADVQSVVKMRQSVVVAALGREASEHSCDKLTGCLEAVGALTAGLRMLRIIAKLAGDCSDYVNIMQSAEAERSYLREFLVCDFKRLFGADPLCAAPCAAVLRNCAVLVLACDV